MCVVGGCELLSVLSAPALQANTSLTYLGMAKNSIGDAGGRALAAALKSGCPALTSLYLTQNTSMSAAAKKELHDANESRDKKLVGLNGLVLDSS